MSINRNANRIESGSSRTRNLWQGYPTFSDLSGASFAIKWALRGFERVEKSEKGQQGQKL